ncbi:MAG: hypothetical protein KAR45_13580, partial [Desulfobacteraceae bacterium]|nr:hypothetical protein [Desulfobacteraceae bacterium]
MKRREFITKSMVAGTWVLGGGLLVSSCKENLRSELMNPQMDSSINFDQIQYMNQETYKILYYASLAPSGHNS